MYQIAKNKALYPKYAIKYIKIFLSKAFQNTPELRGFRMKMYNLATLWQTQKSKEMSHFK
jgi:hypothetical protein